MFVLRLDNYGVNKFKHIAMFQRRVHPHFLLNSLSILFGRFWGERYQFACCDAMVFNMNCTKNARISW